MKKLVGRFSKIDFLVEIRISTYILDREVTIEIQEASDFTYIKRHTYH